MIAFTFPSAPQIYVEMLPTTRLKVINPEFIAAVAVFSEVASSHGVVPVMTGAAFEEYNPASLHGRGYAWDFRSRDFKTPENVLAELRGYFARIDSRYRVLYETDGVPAHFHIEFRVDSAPGT